MQFRAIDIVPGVFPVSARFTLDDGTNWRTCVDPGDDLSALSSEAQETVRAHWAAMDLKEWDAIVSPPPSPLTAVNVEREARRRIGLIADAERRADMALEWSALLTKQASGTLSDADKARAADLKAIWQRIAAIKAAGHALATQNSVPADFATDARWPR